MEQKTLQLKANLKSFKSPQTNQQVNYMVFTVEVDGITVQLKPKDTTGAQLLNKYFASK
ncbi:MAG: hypothetical protein IJF66_07325 [Clostridia bacterium]|nr:hypothetical protein [Clostridia bacterium]